MVKKLGWLGTTGLASLAALLAWLLFLDTSRALATPIYVASTYSAHYPRTLAGNALTDKVYIGRAAAASTGQVVVVDDRTGNAIATVDLPHIPQDISINSATGQAFVATWVLTDKLYLLDGETEVLTEVVASSASFYRLHVAVNANNNRAYLAGYQAAGGSLYNMYLSMFDGNTQSYSPTVHLGLSGFMDPYIVVVTSTNKVYVRVPTGVMVIDSATNQVNTIVPLGSPYGPIEANPQTGDLYAADAIGGVVAIIDGASDSVAATVTVGITPTSIAINPITNLAYVANYGDETISVIDGATRALSDTIAMSGIPRKVEIDTALNRVYVATTTRLKAIDGVAQGVYEPDLVYQPGGDYSNFQDLLVMPSHKVYLADRNQSAADGFWYLLADIDLNASTIVANPNQLPVDGVSQSFVTTTLRDSLGAPVRGVPLSLNVGGNQNQLNGATGVTGADGQASACLWSTLAETKVLTASLPEGKALASAAVVTFTAAAPTVMVVSAIQPGSIQYTHTWGTASQVAASAGTVTMPTVLRYNPTLTPSTQPLGLEFAGLAFRIEAYQGCGAGPELVFQAPVTLTVAYPDPAARGLIEGTLTLRHWTGHAWSATGIAIIQRNDGANQLIARLDQTADLALFGSSHPPGEVLFLYLPLIGR